MLGADWLERMAGALAPAPDVGAVACKMVDLEDPPALYDAGDVLRRDGVCEQRGRFERDDGSFDEPGEVFAACAGAALYRRGAVLDVGGFDERFFPTSRTSTSALRLRLAGWRCRYEPAVARHAGEGSAPALRRPVVDWVERNTLLLVAKAFPLRWLPLVPIARRAGRGTRCESGACARTCRARARALPLLPAMLRERRRLRAWAVIPLDEVVPALPIRRGR